MMFNLSLAKQAKHWSWPTFPFASRDKRRQKQTNCHDMSQKKTQSGPETRAHAFRKARAELQLVDERLRVFHAEAQSKGFWHHGHVACGQRRVRVAARSVPDGQHHRRTAQLAAICNRRRCMSLPCEYLDTPLPGCVMESSGCACLHHPSVAWVCSKRGPSLLAAAWDARAAHTRHHMRHCPHDAHTSSGVK